MTKTVKLIRNGNVYEFSNGDLLFSVDVSTKKISGKDVFEKIYSDANPKETVKIIIDQSALEEEDKKIFGNYVVDLFTELDKGINDQFALPASNDVGSEAKTDN